AKVMTAYLVLRDHPLGLGQDGPTITLTDADVVDTDRRRRQQESVVPIDAGEQLTERQALQALLLPSANNIAEVLARWDAGWANPVTTGSQRGSRPLTRWSTASSVGRFAGGCRRRLYRNSHRPRAESSNSGCQRLPSWHLSPHTNQNPATPTSFTRPRSA